MCAIQNQKTKQTPTEINATYTNSACIVKSISSLASGLSWRVSIPSFHISCTEELSIFIACCCSLDLYQSRHINISRWFFQIRNVLYSFIKHAAYSEVFDTNQFWLTHEMKDTKEKKKRKTMCDNNEKQWLRCSL